MERQISVIYILFIEETVHLVFHHTSVATMHHGVAVTEVVTLQSRHW